MAFAANSNDARLFPAELPLVPGDSQQLPIVFGNLIRNAHNALQPYGGSLAISAATGAPPLPPAVTVVLKNANLPVNA